MCGIAGVVRFDGGRVDDSLLRAMTGMLAHRGPDGEGHWSSGRVGFGHTRLAIIDVGGSNQPMSTPDSRFTVCFNGEIFNYRELRAALPWDYRTQGDTEVLLSLFAADGAMGARRLRGQFAYAMHDAATGDVWLVRDRLGVLPLYYYADAHLVAFASEIKGLLPALPHGPELDRTSLSAYLMQRSVPAPATLLQGVRKVPPGHLVRITPDGTTHVQRYWSLPDASDVLDVTDAEAVDLVDGRLRDAVADAMVADVPVGSYLSGGVDSSLVVALASALVAPASLETFCAEFGDPRFDESGHARRVSEMFSTNHHEVPVRAADFQELWASLTWHRDAPVSEPADVAVFRLAQTARQHVKVVLSGEGSDELFGGYPKYRLAAATAAPLLPGVLRRGALPAVERLLPGRANRLRIALRAQTGATPEDRLATWFSPFTAYECTALLGVDVAGPAARIPATASRDAVDLLGRQDVGWWLPDNLLERGDRMSMAASLELRPPFLDHRLVEDAFRLPSRVKVRNGETKWVLKEVAARYLPPSIVRRPKVGFRVPLDAWFRAGLRGATNELLLGPDSFVADVLDPAVVRRLVTDHESGRRNEEIRIWTLLSLEVWGRTVLRGAAVPSLSAPAL